MRLMRFPTIVCLCGSTKFMETYRQANLSETFKGNIVLTVGNILPGDQMALPVEQKAMLDVLHFRKIELADEILVLNVGDYIGESARREIAYAESLGKDIRYWEERNALQDR